MNNNTDAVPESYPMNGGDGTYSYTKNSYFQKAATNVARSMIHNAVAEKLDLNELFSTSSKNTIFRIADLGCSVGPNTFSAMKNILEVVQHKYQQSQGHHFSSSQMLEFQVFFNDQVTNDFNTLFSSLPSERPYFAAGVPGSFHGRLFPNSSLHFIHSSYALQWLSKLPEELLDKTSPAWNRGRAHYANSPDEVRQAYATQFAKDMEKFLDARAKELVVGGLMVLIMPSIPHGVPLSRLPLCVLFDILGSSLVDMANDGFVSEDQVDSFNIPVYAVSPDEMIKFIEGNGCFKIERMELKKPISSIDNDQVTGHALTMHLRASMEVIISKHFGSEIVDDLFDRFYKKTEELSDHLQPIYKEGGTQLFLVLKRK
ncbi:SAM dependent carboxyl methyltransferase [Trema orientale]|uniref:SAM dependent carboxyl methyltransferase n=1 Tax=Trema orientale TaxID=63057 RepID=A0A2P5AS17_TREOI|nr:SAM dependent carboxyl methyltransferase [Trema orientale]